MLHAISAMIWQALQIIKEPNEDAMKRTKLQVFSHNLSAEGLLKELTASFEINFPADMEKVECSRYLGTVIKDAVAALQQNKSEKEQKICVERVHQVCWEFCKIQLKGNFPSMLTEESTKTWWKIFHTFSERDAENRQVVYPITMDWEEVDHWANVVLKLMALPANSQTKRERDVMGSTRLNFQEAMERFNAKLNENGAICVLDQQGKPDLKYIESSMQELNFRLFEGIYHSGSLLSIKKGNAHQKWCVLYQRGLAFADNPAEVDSANSKAFIHIGASTEVTPACDPKGRSVRFNLGSGADGKPLVFETHNVAIRNKWVTAIHGLKNEKLPDYEKEFVSRRTTRTKNRQLELEAKETLKRLKETTKKKVDELTKAMQKERKHHEAEAEKLRHATNEELKVIISEHDSRMKMLMDNMTELQQHYDQEKETMIEEHEKELQRLMQEYSSKMGSVQSALGAQLSDLSSQLKRENDQHMREIQQKNTRISELEDEVARLNHLFSESKVQIEDMASQRRKDADQAAEKLAAQKQVNAQLRDEAEKLSKGADEMKQKIRELEDLRVKDKEAADHLMGEKAELKVKVEQLESSAIEHRSQSEHKEAQLTAQKLYTERQRDEAIKALEDQKLHLAEENKQLKLKTDELKITARRKVLEEIRAEDMRLDSVIFRETGLGRNEEIISRVATVSSPDEPDNPQEQRQSVAST